MREGRGGERSEERSQENGKKKEMNRGEKWRVNEERVEKAVREEEIINEDGKKR